MLQWLLRGVLRNGELLLLRGMRGRQGSLQRCMRGTSTAGDRRRDGDTRDGGSLGDILLRRTDRLREVDGWRSKSLGCGDVLLLIRGTIGHRHRRLRRGTLIAAGGTGGVNIRRVIRRRREVLRGRLHGDIRGCLLSLRGCWGDMRSRRMRVQPGVMRDGGGEGELGHLLGEEVVRGARKRAMRVLPAHGVRGGAARGGERPPGGGLRRRRGTTMIGPIELENAFLEGLNLSNMALAAGELAKGPRGQS